MGISYSPPTSIDTILFLELIPTHLHQREVRQPHGLSAGAAGMGGMPHFQHMTEEANGVAKLLQNVAMLPILRNPLKS